MKKSILILIAASFLLVGCQKDARISEQKVKPTGTIVDISEKNGQTVNVKVGDKIKFTLEGTNGEMKMWNAEPVQNETMVLDNEEVINYDNTKKGEKFKVIWTFFIVKPGEADLKFNYYDAVIEKISDATDTFTVKVISVR